VIDDRRRGWALAALGMLLVSTDTIFVRWSETDGWTIAFLVAALGLPLQLALQRRFDGGHPIRRFRQSPRGLLTVGLLSGLSQITFLSSATHTEVANVVVIVAASPIMAAVGGGLLFGERTSRRVWIAIGVTISGVVVVVSASIGSPNLRGDLLALSAVLAFSLNISVWRHYRDQSRFVGLAVAALVTIVVSGPFASPFDQEPRVYLVALAMGLVFNPLGRLCHTTAPRYAPSSEVALFSPVETLAATIWAWWAFAEQPPARTFVGGTIILAGLVYGTWQRSPGPQGASGTPSSSLRADGGT
jgi:drug/metabolite transporter (DMT)-like permease